MQEQQKPATEQLVFSIDDVAKMLTVGKSTVYQLLDSGRLDAFHIGRRRLIRADSVRRLVAGKAA